MTWRADKVKTVLVLVADGGAEGRLGQGGDWTKALRMIFAGRAGSTPAVTTLLTANNRNVFIIFPPGCVTASPVMYTAIVGINVYPSSRNFKLFFALLPFGGAKAVWPI